MGDRVVGGVRLHVQRLGKEGDPVVFLHGLVMDNLSSWYFTVANPVARSRRVWLYDLRGHGRSERPPTGYTLEDLAGELAGLLDAEGIESATLVGHSFGGTLALGFALLHPTRCAGLALLDPLAPEPGWGERMGSTLSLEGAVRDRVIAERFAAWLGRHSARKRSKLAENARALVHGTTLRADLARSASWADFRAVAAPSLLVCGTTSDVRAQGERLAAQIPSCELAWVEGSHSLLWEKTEQVRDLLTRWLGG